MLFGRRSAMMLDFRPSDKKSKDWHHTTDKRSSISSASVISTSVVMVWFGGAP
jgi:hypothetical protein